MLVALFFSFGLEKKKMSDFLFGTELDSLGVYCEEPQMKFRHCHVLWANFCLGRLFCPIKRHSSVVRPVSSGLGCLAHAERRKEQWLRKKLNDKYKNIYMHRNYKSKRGIKREKRKTAGLSLMSFPRL